MAPTVPYYSVRGLAFASCVQSASRGKEDAFSVQKGVSFEGLPVEMLATVLALGGLLDWTGTAPAILVAARCSRKLYPVIWNLFVRKGNTFTLGPSNAISWRSMSATVHLTVRHLRVQLKSVRWPPRPVSMLTRDINRAKVLVNESCTKIFTLIALGGPLTPGDIALASQVETLYLESTDGLTDITRNDLKIQEVGARDRTYASVVSCPDIHQSLFRSSLGLRMLTFRLPTGIHLESCGEGVKGMVESIDHIVVEIGRRVEWSTGARSRWDMEETWQWSSDDGQPLAKNTLEERLQTSDWLRTLHYPGWWSANGFLSW